MYVCMYTCMHMYVCVYVCMYVFIWTNMYVRVYVRMYAYARVYVCVYVCMYAYVQVCTCVCIDDAHVCIADFYDVGSRERCTAVRGFIINFFFGAGRDARQFVGFLTPAARRRVAAMCDIDPKKIGASYCNHRDPEFGNAIPIVHFSQVCMCVCMCVCVYIIN
jgi:hypothetical protein